MKKIKHYYIYIMTNYTNTTFYIGVTGDLVRRIYEHKQGRTDGFTKRYHTTKLVYFEVFDDAYTAISREKQLKGGSRKQKIELIESTNPEYMDLYEKIIGEDCFVPRNDTRE